MTDDQQITQRIAAKALIVNDKGQILVLREAETYEEGTNIGRYELPGGRINRGEPLLEGLVREVKEESGLEVEIGHVIYADEWWPVIKDDKNQIVGIFFLCKPLHQNIRLSNEHDDFQWINVNEAEKYDVTKAEARAIEAYSELVQANDKQRRRKLLLS